MINKKSENNDLKDNLIIDATTCDNYDSFLEIKRAGIKYIYYSDHRISTDWAFLMLLELYGGQIANTLGWNFPYLDGRTHLHIAYSNVTRAHYVQMNKEKSIKLKNYGKTIDY
jgi:hypothetical protein